MFTGKEAETILLNQLKEFKISRAEFEKMLHKTIDEELREANLAGPKKLGIFSITGETYMSSLGLGLIEAKNLSDLYIRNDIVVPAMDMVKYFLH